MPLRALAKMTLPMMVGRRRRIEYRATLNPAGRFHFRLRFFYFVGRGFLDCDPGFPPTRALESERFADDYALLPFAFAEPHCGPADALSIAARIDSPGATAITLALSARAPKTATLASSASSARDADAPTARRPIGLRGLHNAADAGKQVPTRRRESR